MKNQCLNKNKNDKTRKKNKKLNNPKIKAIQQQDFNTTGTKKKL